MIANTYKYKDYNFVIVVDGDTLVELYVSDTCDYPLGSNKTIEIVKKWLDEYFNGNNPKLDTIKMELKGTPFQKKVCSYLLEIPYGTSVSYSDIAKKFNERMSSQAIGQAVGRNPICILVPCHRVLGKHNLGGYGFGIELKKELLRIEHLL